MLKDIVCTDKRLQITAGKIKLYKYYIHCIINTHFSDASCIVKTSSNWYFRRTYTRTKLQRLLFHDIQGSFTDYILKIPTP